MRVFTPILALVLALCVMSVALVFASEGGKNICTSKLSSGAQPSLIPPANLQQMTNRGRGSYNIAISICNSMVAPGSCGASAQQGYVAISNATGCTATFNTPLQRPTASTGGFKVKYGSSQSKKDMFELMVLCNPQATLNTLTSRSKKFAMFSPNKLGGTTYMMVAHSHAACGSNKPTIRPTRPHHSELPSGGSSDMPPLPSGGSSDMPSGGSSDMPSGGSGSMPSGGSMSGSSGMPPFPSGGSGSMPSGGSGSMPSGGSGSSDMPSGGSGSMPFPSGGSGSGQIPSGGSGSGYMPSGGSDPVSWSDSKPDSNDTPPPRPSDLPPMSGSGSMGF